jgi:SWI/SNF related-matrix-associated actin-dependent regulator of chromatin subfamily C
MDDDSLNFGSDAAGATPGSNSILAQPPLQGDDGSPLTQEGTSAQGSGEGECILTSAHPPYH